MEVPLGKRLYGGLDATTRSYADSDLSFDGSTQLSRLRFVLNARLFSRVVVFGGPSLNVYVSDVADGSELAPWSVYDKRSGSPFVRLWPGFEAGLRLYPRADR